MKILLTAFDPFGGEEINPSYEVAKGVKANENIEIVKMCLPTVFQKAGDLAIEKIQEENPDAVIMLGQAGGRSSVTIEKIGINYRDARIGDNEGKMPKNQTIMTDGADGLFASLPVEDIVSALRDKGIPASISFSAGTFVCNDLLYSVLAYIKKNDLNIRAGFIHLPYLYDQVLDKSNMPSMDLSLLIEAIETSIEVIADN